MLNELLSEQDLSALTGDQKAFLIQRINHTIDNDLKIREILAAKLQRPLTMVSPNMKVLVKGAVK